MASPDQSRRLLGTSTGRGDQATFRDELAQPVVAGRGAGRNDVGDRATPKGHPNVFAAAHVPQGPGQGLLELSDADLTHVATLALKGPPARSCSRGGDRAGGLQSKSSPCSLPNLSAAREFGVSPEAIVRP
jgi:hypothetical protein